MTERRRAGSEDEKPPAAPTSAVPEAEVIAGALALHGVHGLCLSCGQATLGLLAVHAMPGVEKPLLLLSCPQCGAVFTYRTDVLGV